MRRKHVENPRRCGVRIARFSGYAQSVNIDDRRLLAAGAERADWLSSGRDYSNQRFSPLAQITSANVTRLRPAWTYHSGAGQSQRAGFYAAFDAETGRRLWQFDSTPASGWEGQYRSTTPDGAPLERKLAEERAAADRYRESAKRGGGSAWTTPAVDPALGLIFVGIGNPSPQMDDLTRPGDNLYTVSLVALDAETGALRWYFQQVPHDLWGYDVASPPVLFDVPSKDGPVPAVAQAGKTGWLYALDRRSGRLMYKSEAFVPQQNLFRRPTAEGIAIAPGATGGANWSPVSFDPRSGLVYVAALHMPIRYTVREISC